MRLTIFDNGRRRFRADVWQFLQALCVGPVGRQWPCCLDCRRVLRRYRYRSGNHVKILKLIGFEVVDDGNSGTHQ